MTHPPALATTTYAELSNAGRELRRRLRELGPALDRHPDRQHLVELLEDLHHRLSERFQREEEGGYLEEILVDAPRLATRAETLRRQHGEILDRLGRLEARAERSADGDGWAAMFASATRFREELERHERAETRLVEETLTTDIGAQD